MSSAAHPAQDWSRDSADDVAGLGVVPSDWDVPAWLISMLVNMVVLVGLSLISGITTTTPSGSLSVTSEALTLPDPILQAPEQFTFSDSPEEQIGANSEGGLGAAFGSAPNLGDVSAIPSLTPNSQERPTVEEPSDVAQGAIPVGEFRLESAVKIATGPHFSENLSVRGAAGVGAMGAVGAVDRITHEILLSLEERKTLVVWFFDQSGSLESQRRSIVDRFDRIYQELGVIEASGNSAFSKHNSQPLLSVAISFGEKIQTLTPKPTADLNELKKVVTDVKTDESGIEKTFSAIFKAAQEYGPKFRGASGDARRNVMFVVFTDEVGNDQQGLDATVASCRKFEIPVYVVGVPAPFGHKEAYVKYMPPKEYQQEVKWIPVDQGPESFRIELVEVGFSGRGPNEEPMDSGFGPYSLTRLSYETGGIFFAVHPNREARRPVGRHETPVMASQLTYFFDPDVMRSYRPDYVSTKDYEKLLAENKARAALVQAANMPGIPPFERAETHFPKVSDAELARRLSVAQQAAAVVEPKIDMVYRVLKTGEVDRPKLTQPRWQAGYDLAMGRVLAAKVRAEGYNAMLAKAKQGMKFNDAKDDTWDLAQSDEITVGSALEKQAEQARMYLTRVVTDHAGTPWSLLAERELKEPLGWKWNERYTGVNAPRERRPGNNNNPPRTPAPEKQRMIPKPLPQAPLPKL